MVLPVSGMVQYPIFSGLNLLEIISLPKQKLTYDLSLKHHLDESASIHCKS